MKKTSFILLLSITIIQGLAQTLTPRVICSGYGSGQGGGIKLNYTIGETFVTTLRSGNTVLTQGFHQPEINPCPTPPIAANIPQSITIQCDASIPPFSPEFYMLDGSSVIVTQKDSISSDGCSTIYIQEWIARNQCNDSTIVTRTINVVDTTPPTLIGCQSPIYLSDVSELASTPTISAIDNCSDNVQITFIDSCVGCTEQGQSSHNLFTPARPLDNPCNYPYDWAMALFSLPSSYRWYQLDTNTHATLVYNNDSTVTLTGRVFNVIHPTGGFDFNVNYGNRKTWNEWTSDLAPSGFKADCGGEDANYASWMYYILEPSSAVELIGWGSFAGSLLNLAHAPSNQYFGFQIGDGANNYNADYGSVSWFNYSGVFLFEGQPVTSGQGGGIGDFAFRINENPNTITRTWTATDCAGNASTCSQEFIFQNCNGLAPGSICDDNNPCTVNDVILTDCTCIGTFTDTDNDGTCDANDLCAGAEPGSSCDDNDPCTIGDVILTDCSCAGTFADADNDGTCDANDLCAGAEPGTACDDNDPCTTGDIILADCSCAGTFADADSDGTCDANDLCAGAEPGSACDDNDPCTVGDVILADCSCAGTYAGDDDNDGICNAIDSCAGRPIATLTPADLTLSCEDEIPAFDPEFYMADGSDVFVTQTASVTSDGCSTQIIQVWTGTNDCNESTSVFRTITKNDYFAPDFLSAPADVTIACNAYDNFSPAIPEAIDNCSTPTVSWTTQRIDGDCPMNYTIRYTVDASDACGNVSSIVFNVFVVDQVAPILSDLPADRTVSCEDFADLPVALPSATDNCSSNLNISYTESILPGYCPSNYTVQYTYTALDECGNQTEDSYFVEVIDYTAPIIELPFTGGTVDCITDINERLFTATDNCSLVTLSSSSIEYSDGTHYLVETTYTATDACGNSQIAFVRDTTLLGPIGSPCNDGFYCTVNDMINDECGCTGSFYDENGDFVCDFLQNLTINVTSLTFCPGDFVTLSINEPLTGLTYYWSNNQSGTSIEVNPTQSTTYSVYTIIDGQTVYASVDLIALPVNTFYLDGDGDGFGDPQIVRTSCDEELAEFVLNNLDCNDTSAEVYPGGACDDGNPCTINDAINGECGCVGTLSLPAVGEVSAFTCGSYAWNGNVYTTSGDYEYYTPAATGCDSLTILHLTVGTPTFSSLSVTNCGSYSWNGTNYAQSGTYTYVTTNSTGCPNTATLNLTVNNPSIAASSVIASTNNVSAGTSVNLTVQGGSLGTGASWKWYRGSCGGTLVGTGASITLTANVTETYYVRAEGTCNTTTCSTFTVNVLSAQCGPEVVSASSTRICSGSSTTLSVLGTLYPGAIWRWRRNSCSGTIVGTGANLLVSPTANTTYYVRAEGGTCGITLCMSITIIVDKMPARPSVISGPANGLCNAQNVTYSVTPVSTVQQYNWTVPPGITIVSGQGTASVTVNVSNFINTNPTNGNPAICVTAQNSCGNSPIRCLSLTTYPATPVSISGTAAPCINSVNTYSCPAVFGASSYTWQVPTGWVIQSGQGTASITVLCNGTSGNVRVRSVNACGNSTNRSLACAPRVCGTTAMPMQLELWPNPTSDRVFFAYDEQAPELFEIYDMMGHSLYSGSWIAEFDVTGLAGGIYFVRATSGGESVVKRMEVVR